MDTVILIGADDVRAGGYAMREAAQEMRAAASAVDYSQQLHRQWMDEWLSRFEQAVDRLVAGRGR